MIFHARGERALARIEASLTRSDPALAAEFDRFNTLTSSSPRRHKRRAIGRKLVALVALPLATLATAWATVTGTGTPGGADQCFVAAGAACRPARQACQAASAPHSLGKGARPCDAQSPPNAP